jgi:hypothetical protein
MWRQPVAVQKSYLGFGVCDSAGHTTPQYPATGQH